MFEDGSYERSGWRIGGRGISLASTITRNTRAFSYNLFRTIEIEDTSSIVARGANVEAKVPAASGRSEKVRRPVRGLSQHCGVSHPELIYLHFRR